MAARKPALSTQLKAANARIVELEKKLSDTERSVKYNSDRASAADAEVNQVHAFLDAVPGSIPKEGEGYTKHSAMTRLAAWLATK